MLFSSQQSNFDEYEEITVKIGQRIKFYDQHGSISNGKVIEADIVDQTVTLLCGEIIQYTETVHIDDLIEG